MATNQRIQWIDIAKFFGIFFVVLGHTYDTDNFILSVLYIFHVPLFFFLSGLTYKYKENQLKFIKDKLIRLYIPYLFVSIVSIFVYLLMGSVIGQNIGFDGPNILSCLYGMIYANVSAGNMMWNRPLWFLPALLVVLIITNLIEAVNNKGIKAVLVIALSALGYYLAYRRIFLPLQFETGLCMLVWIYLGILLKKYLFKAEEINKWLLGLIAVILAGCGIAVGFYNGTISVMVDLFGKNILLYIIAALCLSLETVFLSIIINKNTLLEYIGRNTLFILLWHKFPIEFFQLVCPGVKEWLVSPNVIIVDITSFAVAIIAIILCLILQVMYHWFLKKIPINISLS